MRYKAVYLLFRKFNLHVSGVNHTHHQEYTKLELQAPVLVIFFCAATSLQRGQASLAKLQNNKQSVFCCISLDIY